jgi:hypothetical protein
MSDSGQLALIFVAGVQDNHSDDPFTQWLHDEKSIRIDWSTFGKTQIKPE